MLMSLSVDGVVQGPGGPEEDRGGGFERGGWVVPYFDDDGHRFVAGVFEEAGAFLLGRGTYEIFARHWPRITDPGDPVATALNGLPKHVASRTLTRADWHGSTVIDGDLAEAVAELKRRPGKELQVHGSPTLVRWLMAHDLIDEYRLMTFPVVVGQGARLFPEGGPGMALELIESRVTGSGVTIGRYRSAGAFRSGSFLLDS